MPGFDATGPRGQGAMTGWGQGRCGGDAHGLPPATENQGRSGGRGRCSYRGRGGYRGRCGIQGRRGFAVPSTGAPYPSGSAAEAPASDLAILKSEARVCARTLERINARITALESQTPSAETT